MFKFFRAMFKTPRRSRMATLEAGVKAPDFTLPTMTGETFSLSKALEKGPVLLAFFKISCPVCQFAMPYIERMYQASKGKPVTVIAVSQDDQRATLAFLKEYRITMPVALDDTKSYPASNAYGLTTVPTFFLINPEGDIGIASGGWFREEQEQFYRALAGGGEYFQANERIPDLKYG
ncbi:Peroxiredoxin-like protein [Candidatus Koribacter versatilis Ellin345]|uniref:Peroxiredoxin-like protein n=2 Tax=Candidatus Korobacter versatilis TaxID=658062 RepID=Q1ITJ0_KORVE|nr:Peroxiredoxin-like protein [Candidatus Koribacter versatilis Ellin345]